MPEKKHTIPPIALTLLILALGLGWVGLFFYKTFYPDKYNYEKRLEAIVDFMVGRQATDLDEAEDILAEANELLREPHSEQRKYQLIRKWLIEYHDGNLTQAQKNELVYKKGGPKIVTWGQVQAHAIINAYDIMYKPSSSAPPSIDKVGIEMKAELARIEKANKSEFNEQLDALIKGLHEDSGVTLEKVNAFLADEASERAMHTRLMSLTTSVPYLIDMLDDDSEKKRTLVYDSILRIIALVESTDNTITDLTDEQIADIRSLFIYDPKASPEKRDDAIKQIREWTENGINKNLYPR